MLEPLLVTGVNLNLKSFLIFIGKKTYAIFLFFKFAYLKK